MARSKKEKKLARRERQSQLKETGQRIYERLLLDSAGLQEEVEYVLPAETREEGFHDDDAAGAGTTATHKMIGDTISDEDEDRVVLPPIAGAVDAEASVKSGRGTSRKHSKMSWQALKLEVTARYGPEAATFVGEHDGNAEDPFFTVQLKMQPGTVPVPRHWVKLRSFLSHQADREEAVGIIPAEIQALGVDKIRATKDKRANPNQIAFMTCFMTGTPLQRKTFHVPLTSFGDVFHEGKWLPHIKFEPGKLSQRLRQALGMGANSPPPWLYSLQAMRRLPPAYPKLRIPGLNAPIPPGAQWGLGQGQWGEPPRNENNAFLFPGVMDEAVGSEEVTPWGVVPPLALDAAVATGAPATPAPSPPPPQPVAKLAQPAPTGPVITPVPFQPAVYKQQHMGTNRPAISTAPQEYVRVQHSGAGATVAVGHVMVRKSVAPIPQNGAAPPQSPAENSRGTRF